jgi:very-short-patch-repair endonuclease
MTPNSVHATRLTRDQHGVITRKQLLSLGFSSEAIIHRVATGRLHPVWRGVYAVGRPVLGRKGRWMAAVLSCGPGAALSHESAAAALGIRDQENGQIEVSVPWSRNPRRPGLMLHRRRRLDVARRRGIPVTPPDLTLVDLAVRLPTDQLERAVNEADRLDLADPDALRSALDRLGNRPGAGILKRTLDRRTFTLTDSELERRFLPLAVKAGLPRPQTGRRVNGYRVDFYWPDRGLIVETDGLRYHRTPAQQAHDRWRDQAHAAAGLTTLRFTHAQVTGEPEHVLATLAVVAHRLA